MAWSLGSVLVVVVMVAVASAADDEGVSELKVTVQQQASTLSLLQASLAALTSRLDDVTEGCCSRSAVAFHARLDGLQNVTAHSTILFRMVDLNLGHGYDPATGTFRAPEAGLYMFDLKVTQLGTGNLHCHIYHNNQAVAEVEAAGGDGGRGMDRASTLVLLQLAEGDSVRAQRTDGTSTVVYHSLTSSFSGALLNGHV